MNKNTIIAVVLSTIVIVAAMILQPILFPTSKPAEPVNTEETVAVEETKVEEEKIVFVAKNSAKDATEEQTITVETNKAEIVLTNKGGDIVSYKLKGDNLRDSDTGEGVQMVDNVSEYNRACAVAFGNENSKINNDLFNVEKVDENTYIFTKKYSVTNEDGTTSEFIFGKRYTFTPDEYMFKLDVLVHGTDVKDLSYSLRTSPQIGPHFDSKMNRYEYRQFISFNGNKSKKTRLGNKPAIKSYDKDSVWNGITGKYFTEVIVPTNNTVMDKVFYSTLVDANDYANAQLIVTRKPINEDDVKDSYYVYYGPRSEKVLKIYNVSENNAWNLSSQKLTECMQSSGFLGWLEVILKWFMQLLNKFIHNWGISIIVMTLIIKGLLCPLTIKQQLSTLKMQGIQPKMQAVQKKYANNPQKQQEEMAKIYKEAGYNPVSGCLPMILQFLILFAMYNLFNNYFEFRGASFIPGWIPDLSAGDSVHAFKKAIPFFGNHLRLLPIIYLASQLLYGVITQNGGTAATAQNKTQMNMMMYGMPVLFFFMFYNAPSGLLIYWTVSNLFTMVQQLIINRTMKQKRAEIANKNSR
ncbi:MAG: membrane protein insertase YidC [Treponema sp.]|nr:membrane protein insertase YidC [Treponema sp.]